MKTLLRVIPLAWTVLTYTALLAAEDASKVDSAPLKESDVVEALRSGDRNEEDKIISRICAQRLQVLSGLHRVVQVGVSHPEQERAVKRAMELLGLFRANEAVALLVGNIRFTLRHPGKASPFADMPAVRSLIQIGLPALDPLVKAVAESDDPMIRERAALVINQVLGTDLALVFVRDRRHREPYELQRQRLTRLIEQIENVERKRRSPLGAMQPPPKE